MEYKAWQGELKAINAGNGGFEGYGSLIGIRDDGGDVVDAGAYQRSIEYFKHHGFIADGHNWDSVATGAIGTVVDAYEDATGLYLRTEYHSTPHAQAARTVAQERIARGKSVGLSIGYAVPADGYYFGDDGAKHLTEIKLFEVSQVNVPMLREAGLTSVKGHSLSFEDHSENVRDAITEWLGRIRAGTAKNVKEGRPISEARRIRIAGVKDSLLVAVTEIEALLKETELRIKEEAAPEFENGKAVDPKLVELHARYLELVALHPDIAA